MVSPAAARRRACLAPLAATLLLSPLAAEATELNLEGMNRYAAAAGLEGQEQVTSINQFSDVRPTDWAYQALSNLIERYGCVAGYPNGTYRGGQAMSRYEAAALLNACLDRITEVTDELKRLIKEFEKELAVLRGRVDGLEAKVGELEATQFSTTTKLSGLATFVLGGNAFGGSAAALVEDSRRRFGATTFNYDVQLNFDTSFTGKDLLRTTLRAGNFEGDSNSFGGAGPTNLSQLETAFQEEGGPNVVGIDRLFYQVPLGSGLTATIGARVGQEDMLALWPSVYPDSAVLDVLTLNGAPAAYNKNLGAGAGLWWQSDGGLSLSASYVAAHGQEGNPAQGGIATDGAGGTGTVQIGYGQETWGVAAIWSRIQNGNDLVVYGTPFTLDSYLLPGSTDAFGLSGYWQPQTTGWIPSISAGWGINRSRYDDAPAGSVRTSQSWSVGLQWLDAFASGNAAGMAVGQPTFATSLEGGDTPRDGNFVWEWWYKMQLTDNISVTPALFYLSRPLGQDSPDGRSFHQFGGLVKTSFSF
ncbi:carbohydrate porin [Synechococcus sp. CBW1006]|nr:carbohydrate porin [Synechococcus sp. CBW1006]